MNVAEPSASTLKSDSPGATERTPGRVSLLLVRHAPTVATRAFAFATDESLDDRGRDAAVRLATRLPRRFEAVSSPALRCRETADAAALRFHIEGRVRDCDFGSWSGQTLADVHRTDPEGVSRWMTDPTAAPHGGESLATLYGRVAAWLDSLNGSERVVAITHGEVVKAAVVHALGAPLQAFWRIDVDPLSITELHGYDGRWTVARANCQSRGGA